MVRGRKLTRINARHNKERKILDFGLHHVSLQDIHTLIAVVSKPTCCNGYIAFILSLILENAKMVVLHYVLCVCVYP